MSDRPEITVVVPVYNSAETLHSLFDRLNLCLSGLGRSFEILFVDDGSADASWTVLKTLKAEHPNQVSLFRLGKNYGQNAATVCGITHAKGEMVITIDDDLQTPPEEITKLLEEYRSSGSAIVFGVTAEQSNPWFKRAGSNMLKRVFHWVDGADIGSSFRLISPELHSKLSTQSHDQLFLNQVIHWYTDEISKVPVRHEPRVEGRSGYSILGLAGIAIRLIFFYTDFPLRLMSFSGLVIAAICFGIGSYYIYEKLMFGAEAGFASIITAIFFATGIIMLCMSVLGAYISRIYSDRIRKPVYSIKSRL